MKTIQSVIPDIMILAGSAAITYGAYLIDEPYGYISAGVFALLIGVLMARIAR